MLAAEIIRLKRDGFSLQHDQMRSFFLDPKTEDAQLSAMLMAMFLKGLTVEETAALTTIMRESGKVLDWRFAGKPVVDKHSTGGVGDKTSLIILPLCACFDVVVPMMSGRGLGHTGGTLDKLESLPGMNVFPTSDQAKKLILEHGGVFLGQTQELAPLDKKLYALRDVTGTVESISLITASILSKKLASGVQHLVMDVKFGSGAFMQTMNDSLRLAESIANVGRAAGLRLSCLLTSMDQPLGSYAGNANEVWECLEVMRGRGPEDTKQLSLELSLEMLRLAGLNLSFNDLENKLASGDVYEKFCRIVAGQGADVRQIDSMKHSPQSPVILEIKATRSGYLSHINVRDLGLAIVELGGGRRRSSDNINPRVGLSHWAKLGQKMDTGDTLVVIHAEDASSADRVRSLLLQSVFEIADQPPEVQPLVARRMLQ